MSKTRKGQLPAFRFLPEDQELFKGFSVRVKGDVYHVQWRDPITRKQRSKRGGVTYSQVIETIRAIAARTTMGQPVISGSLLLWQIIELFFETEVIPNKKPKTEANYAYFAERFVLQSIGRLRGGEISAALLEEFIRRLPEFDTADPKKKRTDGVSIDQVNHVKKFLKALFRWAHGKGYVLVNPAAGLRLEAVEPAERAIYTPEQFEILLSHANDYYRAHLMVLFWSSMRIGELAAISAEDISHRSDGAIDIHIRRAVSVGLIGSTKTPKSRRIITLPKFVGDEVRRLQSLQAELHPTHPEGLVFTSSAGRTLDGGRFRDRVLYKAWERANKSLALKEKALLPKVTVHGLRHSTITAYREQGHDLPATAVQRHAGHTNLRMTDHYTHLDVQRREAISSLIERIHDGLTYDEECREEGGDYGRVVTLECAELLEDLVETARRDEVDIASEQAEQAA